MSCLAIEQTDENEDLLCGANPTVTIRVLDLLTHEVTRLRLRSELRPQVSVCLVLWWMIVKRGGVTSQPHTRTPAEGKVAEAARTPQPEDVSGDPSAGI